jgi:hypothetical protein
VVEFGKKELRADQLSGGVEEGSQRERFTYRDRKV